MIEQVGAVGREDVHDPPLALLGRLLEGCGPATPQDRADRSERGGQRGERKERD